MLNIIRLIAQLRMQTSHFHFYYNTIDVILRTINFFWIIREYRQMFCTLMLFDNIKKVTILTVESWNHG